MVEENTDASVTEEDPEYITWGYWGASYEDKTTGKKYNSLIDMCYFIAGQRTPKEKIDDLIANNITGVYRGKAQGMELSPDNSFHKLTGGRTELTAEFGTRTISGRITFDQVNLTLDSMDISGIDNFSATVSGTNISYGNASGAFFGPNAENIGGSFSAEQTHPETYETTKYLGIFTGNKQ